MTEKLCGELSDYAHKKLKLSTINIIFILDLFALYILGNVKHNYLRWRHIDFGSKLIKLGFALYSPTTITIILIIIFASIIIIDVLFEYTEFFKHLPTYHSNNGIIVRYNPVTAISRLIYFLWHLIYEVWVCFFTIQILSGTIRSFYSFKEMLEKQPINFCLFIVNVIILILILLESLFINEFQEFTLNKSIDIYDRYRYIIINQKGKQNQSYYLVKDMDLKMFYLVKEGILNIDKKQKQFVNYSNHKFYIINFSNNFDEIKYEFKHKF